LTNLDLSFNLLDDDKVIAYWNLKRWLVKVVHDNLKLITIKNITADQNIIERNDEKPYFTPSEFLSQSDRRCRHHRAGSLFGFWRLFSCWGQT
jgi:hypothetical protein